MFLFARSMLLKSIGVIGSGNWGSAIAKLLGENVERAPEYNKLIKMWVFEETVNGRNLSEIINAEHENVKYLPGTKLPDNVVASSDLEDVASTADILVFVIPHEFLLKTLQVISPVVKQSAVAISLIKGAYFSGTEFNLISVKINSLLTIPVCTLMGANIASDVARGNFSECTLGYRSKEVGETLAKLFSSEYFVVTAVEDSGESEVCGVLKNVIALGCGILSGRNHGPNALAAVIRNGLLEIVRFCEVYLKQGNSCGGISRIFFESSGVADVIVSCSSGRNFRYSEMAAKQNKRIPEIEATEMNGQKLQGYSTAQSLMEFLTQTQKQNEFPLLYAIARSAHTDLTAEPILDAIRQRNSSYQQ